MALRHKRLTSYSQWNLASPPEVHAGDQPATLVRSLHHLGGTRPRKVHSIRRLNRFARSLGFQNWSGYMKNMAYRKELKDNLFAIAAASQANAEKAE